MKKLILKFRYWRYRRLLRKLFWLYARKTNDAYSAIHQATAAFRWFTNEESNDGHINYWWYVKPEDA